MNTSDWMNKLPRRNPAANAKPPCDKLYWHRGHLIWSDGFSSVIVRQDKQVAPDLPSVALQNWFDKELDRNLVLSDEVLPGLALYQWLVRTALPNNGTNHRVVICGVCLDARLLLAPLNYLPIDAELLFFRNAEPAGPDDPLPYVTFATTAWRIIVAPLRLTGDVNAEYPPAEKVVA